MITDDIGRQLHLKATRGKPLTAEVQKDLQEWYAFHDSEESRILNSHLSSDLLPILREQADLALQQLLTTTKRLQEIAVENERLRQENVVLQERLMRKSSLQAA